MTLQISLNFAPSAVNVLAELKRRFGFDAFRHGQLPLIEALLEKRDALGVMPTGGGKSLCFQLPALCLPGTAVVVSPLIALMKDQVDALHARGIAAAAYNSSLPMEERAEIVKQLAQGKLKLLYIAPERIQSDRFVDRLRASNISFLAVDEAHCISQWGHDFRPDYMRLNELKAALGNPPCIALTATATRRVQEDVVKRLHLRDAARVVTGFHRPNLTFEVKPCSSRNEKVAALIARLKQVGAGGSAIVYAATRKNVEWLAEALEKRGISVGHYHAGLSDSHREEVQDDFQRNKLGVLVATNAFGMGIDKPNIRLVTHFDIPGSMEAYYQEAGRAGRDGKPARCMLLFNHADVATQEFFLQNRAESEAEVARTLLKQLVRYAYSKECRQHTILDYFGDSEVDNLSHCGHCDRCLPHQTETVAAPEHVQIASRVVLECVVKLGGRFGKTRVAEILKGSNSAAVRSFGLQTHPSYGLLRSWKMDDLRSLVDRLVASRYLAVQGLEYPTIGITIEGKKAVSGENPFLLTSL